MPEDQATISKRSRSPDSERHSAKDKPSNQKSEKRRRRTGWDVTDHSQPQEQSQTPASATEFATQNIDSNSALISSSLLNPPPLPSTSPMLCRIYVGSLDYYLTADEIKRVFEPFGTIVTIDMPKEGDRSKGFCFVEFATPESAQMALSAMQGFNLKGRSIKVGRPSASGLPLPQPMPPSPLTAMPPAIPTSPIVDNLTSMSPTEAGLFAAAAMISSKSNQDISAILRRTATVSPNITNGFITKNAARSVADKISSSLPNVDPSQHSASRIYVGNVPANFTSNDLEKIFEVFGKILSCYVLPNNDVAGTHRGYGFIDFAEPNQAKIAIDTMNGFQLLDKHLKVNYAASVRQPNTNFIPSASTQILMPPNVNISPPTIPSATGANMTPLGASTSPTTTLPQAIPSPPASAPPANRPKKKLKLSNMVDPWDIDEYLKTEITVECMKHGQVIDVDINIINNEAQVFVTFATDTDALRALPFFNGRLFNGRQITCQLVQ